MKTNILPLSLAALLALGTAVSAQDAQTTEQTAEQATEQTTEQTAEQATGQAAEQPAAEATEEAAPADASSDLSMGTPAEPQPGDAYLREEFGDWALRCIKAEEGPDACQLYQLLVDGDGNAVAEISLFPLPEGGRAAAGATIVVPLETLLTEQLLLSVDGGKPRVYPYSFCNRAGCVARIGFTNADVSAFKAGNAAKLTMVPAAAPEEKVTLDISLTGFTAGYNSSAVEQQ